MIIESESWIDKREDARQALNEAKQRNDMESCKAAAWEIEFWGRVSIFESKMLQSGYSQEWLQHQVRQVLYADERYFTDLAAREQDYILIPIKIREILDDEC